MCRCTRLHACYRATSPAEQFRLNRLWEQKAGLLTHLEGENPQPQCRRTPSTQQHMSQTPKNLSSERRRRNMYIFINRVSCKVFKYFYDIDEDEMSIFCHHWGLRHGLGEDISKIKTNDHLPNKCLRNVEWKYRRDKLDFGYKKIITCVFCK